MQLSSEGLYIIEKGKRSVPAGVTTPSQFLNSVHLLSPRAAKFLDSKAFYCTIPKGKFLLKEGQVCPYMFLLSKGLMRGFMILGKMEITTWITAENDLVSSISSFFNQKPSKDNIQALEDCELVGINYADLETAYSRFPEMNVAARKILQLTYEQAEERAYITRLPSAASRYAYFAETRPGLMNRVSQKIIASHLAMTLETLSRLRSSISKLPK